MNAKREFSSATFCVRARARLVNRDIVAKSKYIKKYLRRADFCDTIVGVCTIVFVQQTHGVIMAEKTTYYVLKENAVPKVLLLVVQAKKLLETGECASVAAATEAVGISRSSFYKYKDDIFPFHDDTKGKTVTMVIQLSDEPGLLSKLLERIAGCGVNILTIFQSIPVNGVATLTLSVDVLESSDDFSGAVDSIREIKGVHYIKILARE